jgi:hypothetical protein
MPSMSDVVVIASAFRTGDEGFESPPPGCKVLGLNTYIAKLYFKTWDALFLCEIEENNSYYF